MLSRLILYTLLGAIVSVGVPPTTQRTPLREPGENGKRMVEQLVPPLVMPALTPALAYVPPRTPVAGTWTTLLNTAIYPVIPIEAKEGTGAFNESPELWKPQGVFEYSGGDLVAINGIAGFLYWGGGHAATPDNSLYFAPFDGSGPRRLTGPYLAPDKIYKYDNPLETYRDVSRNQPSVRVAAAPKSRHTYSSLVTVDISGRPHLFATGGSLYTGAGSGTLVTRLFDLARTYEQAMARPDMGWRVAAPSIDWTTSAACAWDSRARLVVCRLKNIWAAYDPKADAWVRWLEPNYGGSDWEASAAIDVEGRRMFALGNRVAEIIDLDTHKLLMQGTWNNETVVATGPLWTRGFVTPTWVAGGYPNGPGLQWHPRRKRLLAYVGGQDILQIDPAAGTTEVLKMGGAPIRRRPDVGTYGRFRVLPDDPDLVVLATEVDQDVYIGRLPASSTSAPPPRSRAVPADALSRVLGTATPATSPTVVLPPRGDMMPKLLPVSAQPTQQHFTARPLAMWQPDLQDVAGTMLVDTSGMPVARGPSAPPSLASAAPPVTITVLPGQPLPVRKWVERPLPMRSGWSDDAVLPPAEARGLGPSKHARVFWNPLLGMMVIGGGDRAVSMPRGGSANGTGTEIIGLDALRDSWHTLHRFCVPGEPQPGRPDNVVWALDKKRNRALMTPGFYFMLQGQNAGCGSIDGVGGYAFDFTTRKFIGPDDPTILVPPPGGWGSDDGAGFGVVDHVKDELLRVRNQIGLERMNLETKRWQITRLNTIAPHRAQHAIDERGRALYLMQAFGIAGDPRPQLLKIHLDRPGDFPQESIPLPANWKAIEGIGNDIYLAFDTIHRVLLIPDSFGMGGTPLSGLGIYHVDSGVWEWEDVPQNVGGSIWGFDEGLGALVGLGKRFGPVYAYYLYKYGGPIQPLPTIAPPPPVQKVAALSEGFYNQKDPRHGLELPWTMVESAFQVVNAVNGDASLHQAMFTADEQWLSARAELDLPSPDMEVWATCVRLDLSGTFKLEPQMGVAARFDSATATYYAASLVAADGYYLRLYKVVAGVRTLLGSVGISDFRPGEEIRLRVTGDNPGVTVKGFYRGTERVAAHDTAVDRITKGVRAGLVGLGIGIKTGGYPWRLDDWKAGVAPIPP